MVKKVRVVVRRRMATKVVNRSQSDWWMDTHLTL